MNESMGLPDLIEIEPLTHAARAEVSVPGSKSITNRALVLAALAQGQTRLEGALWSEDTQLMADGLRQLGFELNVSDDPGDVCNRTITVRGAGGRIPRAGTAESPLELFVGNAGTAARFLASVACLGHGAYRLRGTPRMHERPQAALFSALRELGYRVDSPNDKLPAVIHGSGPRAGRCRVSIEESSQFASGLLLCARAGAWQVEVTGENAEESPFVGMTTKLVATFPASGGSLQIEADASSGSYFWAAGALQFDLVNLRTAADLPVRVMRWPNASSQVDAAFPGFMPIRGVQSPAVISRRLHLGDSIMTAIVLAPFVEHRSLFVDLGRLRVQECERVSALRTELSRCGARVIENGDTLEVYPSNLKAAEVRTYDDHRMAMCFAILGLKVPGIKIQNPACVKKTFPNFFQKLATPAPEGIGARILDAVSRRPLGMESLFAA
jgi:3-phosphoshikimate 1-carboxyvinyltransferase